MLRSDWATPIAVLIGSGLIAGVLARGLDRIAAIESARSTLSTTAVQVPVIAAAKPESREPAAARPAIGAADEWRLRAQEQAEFAIVPQRAEYVRACWKPAPSAPGSAPDFGGVLQFDVGFDANGVETSRTLRSGGTARAELSDCARKLKPAALKIAPPGKAITVSVNVPIP